MAVVLSAFAIDSPFASYAALSALVAQWTHRTDLGDLLPGFVGLAESRISKDVRLACQLTSVDLVQAAGVHGTDVPDDWLAFKTLAPSTDSNRLLEYVTPEQMALLEREQGYTTPRAYTIDGFRLITGPVTTAPYTLTARYYARLPSLLITDSNWLSLNHPGVYLWAVLIEAMLFTQNTDQMAAYQQRYLAEVEQLRSAERMAAHSGSTLRIRTR